VVAEPSSGLAPAVTVASKIELEFEGFRGFVVGDYRGVAGSGGSNGGRCRGSAARRRAEPEGWGVGGRRSRRRTMRMTENDGAAG
jgi:hypothetical protein